MGWVSIGNVILIQIQTKSVNITHIENKNIDKWPLHATMYI